MPLLAVGVEHLTAPLEVRETVALDAASSAELARRLCRHDAIAEAAVLSTCNRTEVYMFASTERDALDAAGEALPGMGEYARVWREADAAEHLFRVASGLESRVLGEEQILAQVRATFEAAQEHGVLGPYLHTLFRSAISCARQARAGTALGRIGISVASEAVRHAEQALGSLHDRVVLVIGGGEVSRAALQELARRSPRVLLVANRTESVAQELAELHRAVAVPLHRVPSLSSQVDLIFSATSASSYILTAADMPGVDGRTEPVHVFDLAVPRDVDPALGALRQVVLHDLDSLLPRGVDAEWEQDIATMQAVIGAEVHEYMVWYQTRRVVPVIASLRSHVEAVQKQEYQRTAAQLAGLTDRERAAVESMTSRLIDKMFHHLVTRLRLAAQTDPQLVEAAEFFFMHGEGGLFEHAAQVAERDDQRAAH